MNKAFRRLVIATSLGLIALSTAIAAPVVINFPGGAEVVPENLELQGFVFSPSCHYDLVSGALGFDRAGCTPPQDPNLPPTINPNYLGGNAHDGTRAFLYVARVGGGTFSLQSLDLYIPIAGFDLTSSAGGF